MCLSSTEFVTLGVVCDNLLCVLSKYTLINQLKLQEKCIFHLIFNSRMF
jgi:hypothetical protein